MDNLPWLYEALPKALLYASVQVGIGALTVRFLLGRTGGDLLPATFSRLDRSLLKLIRLCAILVAIALLARVAAHTLVAMGDLHWDDVHLIAFESRWGQSWIVQVFAAILLLACSLFVRKAGKVGWILLAAASLLLCGTIPLLGHAAGSFPRWSVHTLHLLATSMWLGSLAVFIVLRRDGAERLIPRFSPLALVCAAVVVCTGVTVAYLYVASPTNLISATYGRTLLLKLATFGGVLLCGWANWRRIRSGATPRTAVLRAEMLFAVAVLVVTAILTELEHP